MNGNAVTQEHVIPSHFLLFKTTNRRGPELVCILATNLGLSWFAPPFYFNYFAEGGSSSGKVCMSLGTIDDTRLGFCFQALLAIISLSGINKISESEEESQDLASKMLATGFFVVHDPSGCGHHNESVTMKSNFVIFPTHAFLLDGIHSFIN